LPIGSGAASTLKSDRKRTWSRNSQSSAKNGAANERACVTTAAIASAATA